MAAVAASAPLFPAFTPARSSACSIVSHVRMPIATAQLASIDTSATPFVASPAT